MCVSTDYLNVCKKCDVSVGEYTEFDECCEICLPGWVTDGNKGGPPIAIYSLCESCIKPVEEEIAQLSQNIEGLQSSLTEWKNELNTASGGDDYAYVHRCHEEIKEIQELMDESELRKADLEVSLEAAATSGDGYTEVLTTGRSGILFGDRSNALKRRQDTLQSHRSTAYR